MEETLVSFKVAKLAKEKGFDEKVYREYDKSGYLRCTSKSADVVLGPYDELLKSTEYPAPTQSLLQRWLREVHNIFVFISPLIPNCREFGVTIYSNKYTCEKDLGFYNQYEKALEVGLFEALKLIKL